LRSKKLLIGAGPGADRHAKLLIHSPAFPSAVINLKTAKALGLALPNTLLALADEVIE
jgi:hypothetical protein